MGYKINPGVPIGQEQKLDDFSQNEQIFASFSLFWN